MTTQRTSRLRLPLALSVLMILPVVTAAESGVPPSPSASAIDLSPNHLLAGAAEILVDEDFTDGLPPGWIHFNGGLSFSDGKMNLSNGCVILPGEFNRNTALRIEATASITSQSVGDFNIFVFYDPFTDPTSLCTVVGTNGYAFNSYPTFSDNTQDLIGSTVDGAFSLLAAKATSLAANTFHEYAAEIHPDGQLLLEQNGAVVLQTNNNDHHAGHIVLRTWRPVPIDRVRVVRSLVDPEEPKWYDTFDFSSVGATAYWPFDNDSEDKTGNGNTGTWTPGGSFTDAIHDRGFSFPTGVFYSVPGSASLQSFDQGTLAAWFFLASIGQPEYLMGKGSDLAGGTTPNYRIFVAGPGQFGPGYGISGWNDNGQPYFTDNAIVPDLVGQWHHYAGTWDGETARTYVDGVLVEENTNNPLGPVTTELGSPFYINRHDFTQGSSSRMSGIVDEAVVFNRALLPEEVAALASDLDVDGTADFWATSAPRIRITGPASGLTHERLVFRAEALGCEPDPNGWSWELGEGLGDIGPDGQATPADSPSVGVIWSVVGERRIVVRQEGSDCEALTGDTTALLAPRSPRLPSLLADRHSYDPESSDQSTGSNRPTVVLTHGLQDFDAVPATLWTCLDGGRVVAGDGDLAATSQRPCRTKHSADYQRTAGTLIRQALGDQSANVLQFFWPDANTGRFPIPLRREYAAARDYVFSAGLSLAALLLEYLGPTYDQPIHFIGHSLGTAVNAFGARLFLERRPAVTEAQYTALGRPDLVTKIPGVLGRVCSFPNGLEIENPPFCPFPGELVDRFRQRGYGFDAAFLWSVLGPLQDAGLSLQIDNYFAESLFDDSWTGVGTSSHGLAVYNHTALREPGKLNLTYFLDQSIIPNDHSGVHQWYRWTVNPDLQALIDPPIVWDGSEPACNGPDFVNPYPTFDQSLSPCREGWYHSISGPAPLSRANGRDVRFSRLGPDLRQIEEAGCDWDGTYFQCAEASSPSGSLVLDLPETASLMDFELIVAAEGDGDFLGVYLDGLPIWLSRLEIPGSEPIRLGPVPLPSGGGERTVEFQLNGEGNPDSSIRVGDVELLVPDVNQLPVADAGEDFTVEADLACRAEVLLDATGSSDPDGEIAEFRWLSSAGDVVPVAQPTFLLPLGAHSFDLEVTDNRGNSAADVVNVLVEDRTPPQLTASLDVPGDNDDDSDSDSDEGNFVVDYSVQENCDPAPAVTAVLEAPGCDPIAVETGQLIEFDMENEECELEWDDGVLEIEAPSLTLVVTATDESGNTAATNAQLSLPPEEDDDSDD